MRLYLLGQLWGVWTLDGDVHADDDNVRKAGSYANYEGPGQRQGQHGVNAQREEDEKRHLTTQEYRKR